MLQVQSLIICLNFGPLPVILLALKDLAEIAALHPKLDLHLVTAMALMELTVVALPVIDFARWFVVDNLILEEPAIERRLTAGATELKSKEAKVGAATAAEVEVELDTAEADSEFEAVDFHFAVGLPLVSLRAN